MAFYKHWHIFHETPLVEDALCMNNFEIRVEKAFKDPMSRQINELVIIKSFQGTLLNSKYEWDAPPIVQIINENKNESRQSEKIASGRNQSVQGPPLKQKV